VKNLYEISHYQSINNVYFEQMLSGSLNEMRYEWPSNDDTDRQDDEAMKQTGVTRLTDNGVCYINGQSFQLSEIINTFFIVRNFPLTIELCDRYSVKQLS